MAAAPSRPDRAPLQHAHFAGELQNLNELFLNVFQEPAPKRRSRIALGMIVGRGEPNATAS
jgi:hypothetical protein